MRSKEVDDAINIVSNVKTGLMNFNELVNEHKDIIDSVEKVLNYISDLEEIVNSIDTQFIHKDKVYEIVEEINKYTDVYNNAVDKFNKLLGE